VANGFVVLWSVFQLSFLDINSKTSKISTPERIENGYFACSLATFRSSMQTTRRQTSRMQVVHISCSLLDRQAQGTFYELFDRDDQDDEKSVSFYANLTTNLGWDSLEEACTRSLKRLSVDKIPVGQVEVQQPDEAANLTCAP
jgi:hypothetical protein